MAETCIREQADERQIQRCRLEIKTRATGICATASILRLAGNETRLQILYLLALEQELCPCDLSDILGLSMSAISQHLRKLKDGNLVTNRKQAQTVYYGIAPQYLKTLSVYFQSFSETSPGVEST